MDFSPNIIVFLCNSMSFTSYIPSVGSPDFQRGQWEAEHRNRTAPWRSQSCPNWTVSLNTDVFHTSSVPCLRNPVFWIPLPIHKGIAPKTEMDSPTCPLPAPSRNSPAPVLSHFSTTVLDSVYCHWSTPVLPLASAPSLIFFDRSFLCLLFSVL